MERNLDQLAKVQKTLIEQNTEFKRSLGVAEKKIINRNERIEDLENILHDFSSKIRIEQERYVVYP